MSTGGRSRVRGLGRRAKLVLIAVLVIIVCTVALLRFKPRVVEISYRRELQVGDLQELEVKVKGLVLGVKVKVAFPSRSVKVFSGCKVTLKAGEEGAYEARVYVLWLTGWEEVARLSFTARDSPRVSIEAPEEVELGQLLVVKISAYDSSGIIALKARVNGSEVPLERRGGVWTFTLTPAEPGLLLIEATAVDPYGNEGSASLRVRVVEPMLLRALEEGLSEVEARALRHLYLLNSSLVRRAQPSLLRLAAKHLASGDLSEEQALGLIDPSVVKVAVLVEVDGCSSEHLEAVKALREIDLPYAVTFPACWIKACRPVAEALEAAEEVVCSAYARAHC